MAVSLQAAFCRLILRRKTSLPKLWEKYYSTQGHEFIVVGRELENGHMTITLQLYKNWKAERRIN